jgi:hypothetical protein
MKSFITKPKSQFKVGQVVSYDNVPGIYKIVKKEQCGFYGSWSYDIKKDDKVLRQCTEKHLNAKGSKYFENFA